MELKPGREKMRKILIRKKRIDKGTYWAWPYEEHGVSVSQALLCLIVAFG